MSLILAAVLAAILTVCALGAAHLAEHPWSKP